MTLTLAPILVSAGIDPAHAIVIRHSFVLAHADGERGLHADSTNDEILAYTSRQSADTRTFSAAAPRQWVIFMKEGGDRARLWSVVDNHGETYNDGTLRGFDLRVSDDLADLRNRLVISWPAPRSWKVYGITAAGYRVAEVADARPLRFPGFDRLIVDRVQLQALMREHRYTGWRTALASVKGIYLITDTRDGRQYVGKADGAETILQRWSDYATTGHGGNVELRGLDPATFRYSILRVFDPATPTRVIDEAESHFKQALDTREHGLNRN